MSRGIRVARRHIFKPKIPIWVNFGGSYNGRCWLYFMEIWSILRPFGILCGFYHHLMYLFPVLVCCAKGNLATLLGIKFMLGGKTVVALKTSSKTKEKNCLTKVPEGVNEFFL
jgi:hypothetical protein